MSNDLISYKVNHLQRTYWANRTLPVDPFEIAHRVGLGLRVDFDAPGRYQHATKEITFHPGVSHIVQRFGVAHALGHYALGHGDLGASHTCSYSTMCFDSNEIAANTFALELLIPKLTLEYLILKKGETDLNAMARQFNVGAMAVRLRLIALGLLSGSP